MCKKGPNKKKLYNLFEVHSLSGIKLVLKNLANLIITLIFTAILPCFSHTQSLVLPNANLGIDHSSAYPQKNLFLQIESFFISEGLGFLYL